MRTLRRACLRRVNGEKVYIPTEFITTVLESILLPSHGIRNGRHIHGKLRICSCGKEIDEIKPILCTEGTEHSKKK